MRLLLVLVPFARPLRRGSGRALYDATAVATILCRSAVLYMTERGPRCTLVAPRQSADGRSGAEWLVVAKPQAKEAGRRG
jgi:hypothetical protein